MTEQVFKVPATHIYWVHKYNLHRISLESANLTLCLVNGQRLYQLTSKKCWHSESWPSRKLFFPKVGRFVAASETPWGQWKRRAAEKFMTDTSFFPDEPAFCSMFFLTFFWARLFLRQILSGTETPRYWWFLNSLTHTKNREEQKRLPRKE